MLCLAAILTPVAAQAQDMPESPPIVVTATRTSEGAASTVATIGADTIARLQPISLIEALNDVAGVRAVSTGGVGGGSYVSVRGGEPNFTLVLLDGVRVNDPTNSKGGAFDFSLIDPALVRAVEVNRGASSAVHGSDALSGVINIRMADPPVSGTAATARVQADTGGQAGGGAALAQGWDGGGLIVGGSAFDSAHADPGSTLRRQQGLARLRQRIGDYDAVAIGIYAHDRHSVFPEDSGGPKLAVLRDREQGEGDLWTAALAIRHAPEGRVRPEVSLSYSRQTSDTDTPAIAPGMLDGVPPITARNRLIRFEAIGDVVLDAGPLTATIGAAYLSESGRSRGTIDFGVLLPADFSLDRRTASGFAEATLKPVQALTINGAVRYDAVAHRRGEWTGRAGVALQPWGQGPSLFARIGEGFKLPSFYALGSPFVGNSALRPERSRNIEAGVQWSRGAALQGRIAWFDNRFSDLVDFDPVLFTSVNRSRVRASGMESETTWRPSSALMLGGALTYLTIDSATPLRARPRWQGNVRAAWRPAPPLELGATLRFNSSFYDSSIPTGLIRTGGHEEVDASARYALSRRLSVDLTLRNIGDVRDQKAVGFPSPGRTLRATIAATL
jgi:outer membrane cobalamin receptor